MNKNTMERLALVLGGVLVGAGTTYLVVNKALETKYRDIAEEEIASVKESYDLLYGKDKHEDPKVAFDEMKRLVEKTEAYAELLDEQGYFKEEVLDEAEEAFAPKKMGTPDGRPDPETVVRDILEERVDPPRYEDGETPYVITVEEFMSDRDDHEKITVSYYEYDNTAASEDDSIIHDHESSLGPDFVKYIGWKAAGRNTVYVRNEKISADFEILVHEGSYQEDVLGILPDEHPKKKMLIARNDE